ncbi:hypothetical protein CLV92_103157 [Kineococcus xinjiangensis]|uniref:Uncharacterized protein n=1 Tax=Kineococcus xinjiangensis TaxID=512762 RepID=A0A2S6ITP9_9ACTN|nr:hypothetical protein [Kineococcus xinjiangensis]PPK97623.1 hypothetical protein CLV92_103157 [Kineococcus xinjiangensis]
MSTQANIPAGGDPVHGNGVGTPDRTPANTKLRLLVGWTLVGIPLLYGVVETLNRASKLFTG